MLSGRLVRDFCELADQLLEDEAHLGVVDALRVKVDRRKLLRHEIEEVRLRQSVDLDREFEAVEDVADVLRESADVGAEVRADIVLVADQLFEVERRRVVEAQARFAPDEDVRVDPRPLPLLVFCERRRLGRRQDAIEPSEHRERQDDLAVVRLLVVAA